MKIIKNAHQVDKLSIDEIFLNEHRTRVLGILLDKKSMNLSKLMAKSGLNYSEVMGHLLAFEKMGLITEKVVGGDREFSLIEDLPIVQKLHNLKNAWDADRS